MSLTLRQIADRINVHLKAMEGNPEVNRREESHSRLLPYWYSGAHAAGRYVGVTYVSFQGTSHLSKSEASIYLAWLDSGRRGKHWEALDATKTLRGRKTA